MNYKTIKQPEFEMTLPLFETDYKAVCGELTALSKRMLELLPDPSIGPEERLERIARIVPYSLLQSKNMKTARTKLNNLKNRLNELVPDTELTALEKLEILIERVNKRMPEPGTFFEKLEELGDKRVSDIGR